MAVQQNKVSRSKRDMRRSHRKIKNVAITEDQLTGNITRRHHLDPEGYYRGTKLIDTTSPAAAEEESE